MKRSFFCLVIGVAFSISASSQNRTSAVFFEFPGNGGLASLNYDLRFSKSNSGFGGRIGIGAGWISSASWFGEFIPTLPLAVNYLTGQGSHHLEASAGVTFGGKKFEPKGGTGSEQPSSAFFIPGLGYRYQPADKGFSFRLFVAPFIGKQTQFWGGLSIGACF